MNRLIYILAFIITAPACVTLKSVGGYEIYGQVVDAESLTPLAGVQVAVRFEALSAYGNTSKVVVSTETAGDGSYRVEVPETRLWGGTGGWSGYVSKWPGLRYQKAGYCTATQLFPNPELSSYQDVTMRLNRNHGQCVEAE